MQRDKTGVLWYSPSDLIRFVESPYASFMDRCYLEAPDTLEPDAVDPLVELLMRKGTKHEKRHLEMLCAAGHEVAEIAEGDNAFEKTTNAVSARRSVIYQACLELAPFRGYADFLEWSEERGEYAVWDTKLAASVKRYYLIQLCCYAEALEALVGKRPTEIGIVLGTGEPVAYRTDDFFHYYLGIKRAFLALMSDFDPNDGLVPDMRADHGRWQSHAEEHLQRVDHLVRVAGISRGQVRTLEAAGITTLTSLAQADVPRVPKLAPPVLERLREQATLQVASARRFVPAYRVMVPERDDPRRGLALLPPPSPQDVYFDMEGDPLVEGGLEYLFGAVHLEDGKPRFWDAWAFDRAGEQAAFERFVDWVIERWRKDRSMHVYHYAPYEVSTLKRLMGSFASRQEEVDHLLRSHVFVDLYTVVRQGVRIGTGGYSLKDVETLYLEREGEVESGGESIIEFERFLAGDEPRDWKRSPILKSLRDYNQLDCESTWQLARWLRERQSESGVSWIPPATEPDEDVKPLNDDAQRRRDLSERLLALAPGQDVADAHISTMLAHLLEFHRREDKPAWWSFFERHEMTSEQLEDDVTCIGDAVLESGPIRIKESQAYWYSFDPDQDTKIEAKDRVYIAGLTDPGFLVEAIDSSGRVQVKLGLVAQARLPDGAMPARASFLRHKRFTTKVIEAGIESVAQGWADDGALPSALRNFFGRVAPPMDEKSEGTLLQDGEDVLVGATRVVRSLRGGTLAIQGPPGSGKTYTASFAIKELLDAGRNVGVVSNSHEAVFNVLRQVNKRYEGQLRCLKVGDSAEHALFGECPGARHAGSSGDGAAAYGGGLIGGTAWLFSRDDMAGRLDYLFVDEAGQVSTANLVGMARSARNIVLLGDQMQLAQPLQGSHPGDSGTSALEYVLGERSTVPPDLGIFLPTTYRLHPDICSFISGAIYEDRLAAKDFTRNRILRARQGDGAPEAGIWFIPVAHDGDTQASDEEVACIADVMGGLLGRTLTDQHGREIGPLQLEHILFVAPYNMQVRRLRDRLPGARVASVDKFQGQEAPVVIVSLCRSFGEAESGGRGLDFVLDRNRLNVAVSRAQSLAIVVGDARLALTPATSIDSMRRLSLLARLVHEGTPQSVSKAFA